jgi:hypothetical protein
MKLNHGWNATMVDGSKRVLLTKPGIKARRTLCMQWEPPFLRRVDPVSGVTIVDTFDRLPPDTRSDLVAVCKARWGMEKTDET